MVYKRYIKRGGKLLGPYYYKTIKTPDGKVRSIYVGPVSPKEEAKLEIAKLNQPKEELLSLPNLPEITKELPKLPMIELPKKHSLLWLKILVLILLLVAVTYTIIQYKVALSNYIPNAVDNSLSFIKTKTSELFTFLQTNIAKLNESIKVQVLKDPQKARSISYLLLLLAFVLIIVSLIVHSKKRLNKEQRENKKKIRRLLRNLKETKTQAEGEQFSTEIQNLIPIMPDKYQRKLNKKLAKAHKIFVNRMENIKNHKEKLLEKQKESIKVLKPVPVMITSKKDQESRLEEEKKKKLEEDKQKRLEEERVLKEYKEKQRREEEEKRLEEARRLQRIREEEETKRQKIKEEQEKEIQKAAEAKKLEDLKRKLNQEKLARELLEKNLRVKEKIQQEKEEQIRKQEEELKRKREERKKHREEKIKKQNEIEEKRKTEELKEKQRIREEKERRQKEIEKQREKARRKLEREIKNKAIKRSIRHFFNRLKPKPKPVIPQKEREVSKLAQQYQKNKEKEMKENLDEIKKQKRLKELIYIPKKLNVNLEKRDEEQKEFLMNRIKDQEKEKKQEIKNNMITIKLLLKEIKKTDDNHTVAELYHLLKQVYNKLPEKYRRKVYNKIIRVYKEYVLNKHTY